ncbi:MAG: hypothetical protein RLZZ419_1149, partial [Pseudomonadota bacterium]
FQQVRYLLKDYPRRNNVFIKSSTPQDTNKLTKIIVSEVYMMLVVLIRSLLMTGLFIASVHNNYLI